MQAGPRHTGDQVLAGHVCNDQSLIMTILPWHHHHTTQTHSSPLGLPIFMHNIICKGNCACSGIILPDMQVDSGGIPVTWSFAVCVCFPFGLTRELQLWGFDGTAANTNRPHSYHGGVALSWEARPSLPATRLNDKTK